jgi:hypothetical protein
MTEPTWISLIPIDELGPHQPTRGCWCGPTFAIDIRSTLGRDDVRVLLHRGSSNPTVNESLLALRARKGEVVALG